MKPVVLVVDDDTAICALLQDVLSEHVFTVSVCHTGQEAILRIEGDPDICAGGAGYDATRYQRPEGIAANPETASDIAGGDVDRHGQ